MNTTLTKILKMANSLSKAELIALNQAIVGLIQNLVNTEISHAVTQFNKGDIVSFTDNNNIRRYGIIAKRNQKTFQVLTLERYSINVSATYLRHEPKPPAKLVKFRKELLITKEDQAEVMILLNNYETKNFPR